MRVFIGLILIAVGVFALLVKLDVLSGSLWSYVWPSIIIALGLSFLWVSRSSRGWRHWCCHSEEKEKKD